MGRELLLHFIEHLVTKYNSDEDVTNLLNTATVHILPSMNPDGFAAANTTDCLGIVGRLVESLSFVYHLFRATQLHA